MDWLATYKNMPHWWELWITVSLVVIAVGLISLVVALSIPWFK